MRFLLRRLKNEIEIQVVALNSNGLDEARMDFILNMNKIKLCAEQKKVHCALNQDERSKLKKH